MRTRPMPVTVAAILLALFSLMNLPGPWWNLIPGAMIAETPTFVIYSGIVLGIAGVVATVGLWMMKRWSWWATIVVCVLNILLNLPAPAMVPTSALLAAIVVQTIGFIVTLVLIVLPSARHALTRSRSRLSASR